MSGQTSDVRLSSLVEMPTTTQGVVSVSGEFVLAGALGRVTGYAGGASQGEDVVITLTPSALQPCVGRGGVELGLSLFMRLSRSSMQGRASVTTCETIQNGSVDLRRP